MDKSRQNRKISIELLRIVAMFLIVLCHSAEASDLSLRGQAAWTMQPFRGGGATIENVMWQYGQVGVQIFFIITGYFLCKKAFSLPRAVKAWVQVFLYSVLIGGLLIGAYLLTGYPRNVGALLAPDVVIKNVTKVFAPILSFEYWFMTSYILLLLIAPALNNFAKWLGRRGLERELALLALLSVTMLIFPAMNYYNGLLMAIFGYSIGAYIRLYVDVHSAKFRPRNLWIVILACAVVSATFTWLALDGGFIARSLGWVTQPAVGVQLTMPVIAAALFILFLRKDAAINRAFSHKKRLSTAIFALSAATFGVYLIHTNPFLWGTIFGVANSLTAWANNAPFLWKMSLLCLITVCIFALCAVAAITLDRLLSPAKKFLVAKITPRLAKLKIFAD